MLVKTDGGHHRGDARTQIGLEDRLFGYGVHAVECDGRSRDRQLAGRYADRTLAGVEVERHIGIVVDARIVFQQPRDRLVVEVGRGFRFVKFVDDLHARAAESFDESLDRLPFRVRLPDGFYHRAGGDRTGVYQRCRRVILFEQDRHDRVERQSRSVGTDLRQHLFGAVLVHR